MYMDVLRRAANRSADDILGAMTMRTLHEFVSPDNLRHPSHLLQPCVFFPAFSQKHFSSSLHTAIKNGLVLGRHYILCACCAQCTASNATRQYGASCMYNNTICICASDNASSPNVPCTRKPHHPSSQRRHLKAPAPTSHLRNLLLVPPNHQRPAYSPA